MIIRLRPSIDPVHHHASPLMADVPLNPPKHSDELELSFPVKHVIVLTMNRPKALNAMSRQLESDIKTTLNWFDDTPSLWCVRSPISIPHCLLQFISRVAIVTGKGKAFCAGADLKEYVYGLIVFFFTFRGSS